MRTRDRLLKQGVPLFAITRYADAELAQGATWKVTYESIALYSSPAYLTMCLVVDLARTGALARIISFRLDPALGYKRAHYLGLFLFACACLLCVGMCAANYVIPQRMLPIQIAATPVLLGSYHWLLVNARGPESVVRGAVVVTLLFCAVNVTFAATYVGWL